MGNLLEFFYDLMVRPRTAFTEMMQAQTLKQSFFVVLCSTVLGTMALLAGMFDGGVKWFILILQIISTVCVWTVSAALWHLFAELLGGTGSVKQLLKANGFIYFVQILVIPVYLIAYFLPGEAAFITAIVGVAVVVWTAVLEVLALQAVHGLSGAKAVLVLLLPLLLLLGICIVIGVIGGSFVMSAASELMLNPPEFH